MKAMRVVWAETLIELAKDDERLVVLDGDLANSTMASMVDAACPDRFIEMGIAEQNLVGAAAGMAHTGFVPWVSSFAVFLTHRAADPLRMLVAQTRANVKIAGAYSGMLTGVTGKSHQDVQDLAIVRAMPEMTVLAPADEHECRAMICWAMEYQGPVYLRLARDPSPAVFDPGYRFVPGAPVRVRGGSDIALISTGVQTPRTLAAAERLAADGIDAAVIHLGSIKPLEEAALVEELAGFDTVVTTEEHSVIGGLGGLVAEVLSAHAPARVVRIGVDDEFGESAPNEFLLERYGLSPTRVAERVREVLA
ncbi:MAG: transketolase C-terminal domain-containing protein [Myxococcota bacterium]|jgi:transketolase|nr:transketolase C-terminal domain-containing protein [Myxococcota bacterium]